MKITRTQLKRIIKEEMENVLNENMACEELTKELAGYYQQQNAIVSQLGMQAQGDPAYEDLDRSIASVSQRAREAGCNNAEMSLKAKSMAEKG